MRSVDELAAAGASIEPRIDPITVEITAIEMPLIAFEPDAITGAELPEPVAADQRPESTDAESESSAEFSSAPEKNRLQLQLDDLQSQNAELIERIEKLDEKITRLESKTSHETVGVGIGIASGLKNAQGEHRLVLEANLRYFYACLYAQNGVCGGVSTNLHLWNVRLRWFGIGLMYYGNYGIDRALSVPEFERKFDLMLTSGLDWRVWEGLELRAQAAWFIPSPKPVYNKAKERIEQAAEEFDIYDSDSRAAARHAPSDAWDIVTEAYKRAFRSPYLIIGARWEF
ncbi:MAG: hypothetical protein WCT10_00720 [Patescibacteria group bacterium]